MTCFLGTSSFKSTKIQISSAMTWLGSLSNSSWLPFSGRKQLYERSPSGVMSNRPPGPRSTTECLSKTVGYKMEQISADFHLISSCNRRMPVQLLLRRKTSGRFNSLPSSHSYPAYEMEQISADFHLISRLSGSHLKCHSYKSH